MKITLLYSLLIYQLLQHCDATGECRPLSEVRAASFGDPTATIRANCGSNVLIYSITDDCSDPNSSNYVLLHQNHHTRELDVVSQQQDYKFMISNVQLNTSGIYCTYKQCTSKDREQCCVRLIVPPEVKIIFPDLVQSNIQERGVCYAKSWPLLTTNDIDVFTDDNCAITKSPLNNIDTYTSTIFFTLDNINSSCQHISCLTKFNEEARYTNIKVVSTTSTSTKVPTLSAAPGLAFIPEPFEPNDVSDSGALGLYRITLWIIVLTLTILNMTITYSL